MRLEETSRRFGGLLQQVNDPDRRAVGKWSVCDTAAHVALLLSMYEGIAAGNGSLATSFDSTAYNDAALTECTERDLGVLAERMARSTGRVIAALRAQSSGEVPWHAGTMAPTSSLGGLLLGELVVHGRDIARAAKLPWEITSGDAVLIFCALMELAPVLVTDTGATRGTVRIHLRGGPTRYMTVDSSGLRVDDTRGQQRAWLHISANPVAFVLVGYGRLSPWKAAATGRLFGWGRPGLAMKFSNLVPKP